MFIEGRTLQLVLAKPSDLAIDELVQIRKLEPLLVEHEDPQLVEFEPVNNHLTHGNIKGTYVYVHYYHDVHDQDNNATIYNDQNDIFSKVLIDICVLGVSNPKGCIHSQPQKSFSIEIVQRTTTTFILSLCFYLLFHIVKGHE